MASAVSLLLTASGCALMRKDTAPLPQIPGEQVRVAQDTALPDGAWPSAAWWQRYADDQLGALVTRALQDSPSMAVARTRVDASRAQTKLVDASSGLLVGLNASVNRQKLSENGFLGPFAHTNPEMGTTGPWYTEGTIGVGAGYTLDLWGKDRARVNAAMGVAQARQAEAAQAALLLSSQVVQLYYEIQTTYALEALLEQARDVRRNLVAASQARTARGLEPRTQAETAQAQLLQLDQQITVAQTRVRSLREGLRALTGAGPDDLPAIAPRPLPDSAGGVPSSLGYELLARRPDLQAMRWYVQASMDQIDAAKAAFYPSFDIRAFLGLDSLHLADLLRKSSRQINVIPGLSLPIFDSGRLNANLAATRSQSNALIAQYNESVLNAVREVAQAGIELDGLNRQAAMQESKLKSVSFASNSAEAHYRQGLLDKPSALEARLPLLMEQSQAVEIRSKQIQSEIALTRALGGGYTSGQTTQNDAS
ncbi:efflux transporter outer membrane subunit [Cupriavidus basilensis]|uniref:Efflux transporter outer membrane subunit n=2 Tax=Cupriavidus basilensis TaxID=68895 RepID=A0A643FTE9_9BURK|nr:efflux transporter outer membrane subunit [Cupriavidus basilensis]